MTGGKRKVRHLIIVFGDQLNANLAAFDGFDPSQDAVLQMEVRQEATYIPQHKKKIALFFAAMRHFRDEQRAAGLEVYYSELLDPQNTGRFDTEIRRYQDALNPERLIATEPGDFRVKQMLDDLPFDVEVRADRHFLCSREEFAEFVADHKTLVLDTFYRGMRYKHDVLLTRSGGPAGGKWNYDQDNRASFAKKGPPFIPRPPRFPPDDVTRDVLALVNKEFASSPGRLDDFEMPVTRAQALAALQDFVENRLPLFGRYQDAMSTGEHLLFHSHLSAAINLHLLSPREVLDAALANPANAPLNSIEGFVRQILGWREFVRGIYWHFMPDYADGNTLRADLPVPKFFWTGETDMRCLAESIRHTIDYAYAHHIERLMVLGLFNLLLGVKPYDVHRWHMSMFWDSIDWVSLPNTLGMSQFGDGGVIGTKPYVASGNYINRMSDYCGRCRYNPQQAIGDKACPFTTLYWDFLARHDKQLRSQNRMKTQYANLDRKDAGELAQIRQQAHALKAKLTSETFL